MNNLTACFPVTILGSPLCPAESVKNFGCGSIPIFPCQNMLECLQKLFCALCEFRHVRQFVNHHASVANALVSSQSD